MRQKNASGLRPQDVLILLKLFSIKDDHWKQNDLAHSLGLSQAEIANSLERLRRSSLIDASKRKPYRLAAIDFLIHAIKYFYPPELGTVVRGLPTGHSAKPLKGKLIVDENIGWVWPDEEGESRGLALYPIYETVPLASKKDPELYELLALIDSVRAGGVRERKTAEEELRKRIMKYRGKENEAQS